MIKPAVKLLIACAFAALAGGCGLKGSLEAPEAQSTASAESGQGKPAGATAKPHEPFVLDGLIR